MPAINDAKKLIIANALLQKIKENSGPLVGMLSSANHRDRARKIYDLAKELQDDLAK